MRDYLEESRALRARQAAIVAALAQELGPDWTVEQQDYWWTIKAAAVEIACHFNGDKLRLNSGYGDDLYQYARFDEGASINVNSTRPAAAIVRDMRRRLIPQATEYQAELQHRKAVAEDYAAKRAILLSDLAAILGEKMHNGHIYLYRDNAHGAITPAVDYVQMELHSVSPDLARSICRLIAG